MSICGPRNGRDRVLKGASAWKNSLIWKFSSHHNDNNEVKIVHNGMLFDAEVFSVSKRQIKAKTPALIDRPKSNVHPNTLLRLGAHSDVWPFAHAHSKSH